MTTISQIYKIWLIIHSAGGASPHSGRGTGSKARHWLKTSPPGVQDLKRAYTHRHKNGVVYMVYYVLGIEAFKQAEVYGVHQSKKKALNQLSALKKAKTKAISQRFEVLTSTEVKKRKLELYT